MSVNIEVLSATQHGCRIRNTRHVVASGNKTCEHLDSYLLMARPTRNKDYDPDIDIYREEQEANMHGEGMETIFIETNQL